MTESFPAPPTFTEGQVMSASGHLNLLRASVLYLLGMYQQGQGAWSRQYAEPVAYDDGWDRWWDGWLRQQGTTLEYSITVTRHPTDTQYVRILYNHVDLTPHLSIAPGGNFDETVTLTGTKTLTGTTDGEFYALQIERQSWQDKRLTMDVGYLRQPVTASYPTLATFASGTPTAAEWQALSTAAQTLYETMRQPRPLMSARNIGMEGEYKLTVSHRTNTLFYRVRWRPPFDGTGVTISYDKETGITTYTYGTTHYSQWIAIDVDGVEMAVIGGQGFLWDDWTAADATTLHGFTNLKSGDVLKMKGSDELIKLGTKSGDYWTGCTRGYRNTTAVGYHAGTRGELWQEGAEVNRPGGYKWEYFGTVDLSSLGLTEGADYTLAVVVTCVNEGEREDIYGGAVVQTLTEQGDDIGIPAWWTAVNAWAHGDTVNGTGGVKGLRDNLAALIAKLTAYNYPAQSDQRMRGGSIMRQHRILHYRCEVEGDAKLSPSISYMTGTQQQISLPFEPNKWLTYDLEGAKGLWVGTEYAFHDVTCAMEDVD